jgi:hypothetical protein
MNTFVGRCGGGGGRDIYLGWAVIWLAEVRFSMVDIGSGIGLGTVGVYLWGMGAIAGLLGEFLVAFSGGSIVRVGWWHWYYYSCWIICLFLVQKVFLMVTFCSNVKAKMSQLELIFNLNSGKKIKTTFVYQSLRLKNIFDGLKFILSFRYYIYHPHSFLITNLVLPQLTHLTLF